ncbi:3-hydroxyacyl-ACP dehydratase FabZ [Melissococcus plutonius]|uniref:3-hydroxyacyl-[acyl-carrier-protein] dehydratase FabZ n=1 Tax=Melissococcus plutonius (strain ATCC 35311 / DSM 29964 / CIP 104052 / LMG 20360 / NCIMB 702443) TaxID=940190 RepID=F3Y7Y2_MELPT|nr:3-hydroxyacyl-ACP dehydratase FabZ [Melissococcus plutonius]AIM24366.1 3-hydroxyacyl-(acyl-carrier-protein) dehydratase FabZ [Melissococcus plutonius S1]KMT25755.1 3-hydroxyacyl-(acyl-carrier-protein) dehydratase FabZ [Melissococcus plutonius]KMT27100.1 3-hydroxyacyl-(acyl-carrier-protein) dehydratase FabZ [Melissococcus plutonius]KMT28201.1 3-hydroxyacyl-(acyl-carrier-protein) dehydratase FabZ [Melissococcus plutonius]KMT29938.1 3-hydroxyacyl-(acyl-carrier-protein) dehydratase FabZ [Meliss
MEKVLTAEEVMALIPNRYPICYIDYVDELTPNKKIIATKNVTINEEFFQGHFPGNPTMPGVLILESLAQAGSILILKTEQFNGKTAYIGGIDKAKFRQKVVPGDVLKLHFEIIKQRETIGTAQAAAYVEGKKVCECQFTFIIGQETR